MREVRMRTKLHTHVAIFPFSTHPVNKRSGVKVAQRKGSKMQLFVQGQALHALNVTSQTTVDELKGILAQQEGIPPGEQVLAYGGVPLEGDSFVCQSVPELATLSLTARVVGGKGVKPIFQTLPTRYRDMILTMHTTHFNVPSAGKVHGSLARAGKVRGQTPKVCTFLQIKGSSL